MKNVWGTSRVQELKRNKSKGTRKHEPHLFEPHPQCKAPYIGGINHDPLHLNFFVECASMSFVEIIHKSLPAL